MAKVLVWAEARDVGLEHFGAPRKSKMLVFRLSCTLWRAWHLGAARKHRIHVFAKNVNTVFPEAPSVTRQLAQLWRKEATFTEKKTPTAPAGCAESGLAADVCSHATAQGSRGRLDTEGAKRTSPLEQCQEKVSTKRSCEETFHHRFSERVFFMKTKFE